MLRVQVSPRKSMYVSFTDDTCVNKGGFYCQVYYDEDCEFEFDNFVIHNYELRGLHDYNERLDRAYKLANIRVKDMMRK